MNMQLNLKTQQDDPNQKYCPNSFYVKQEGLTVGSRRESTVNHAQ